MEGDNPSGMPPVTQVPDDLLHTLDHTAERFMGGYNTYHVRVFEDDWNKITAALNEARERADTARANILHVYENIDEASVSHTDAVKMLAAVRTALGNALSEDLRFFATPPPTDPPRHPHDALTAAEGEALDDLEEAWREETRRFIRGEGGSIERVQAARARLPDGVLSSLPLQAMANVCRAAIAWKEARFVRDGQREDDPHEDADRALDQASTPLYEAVLALLRVDRAPAALVPAAVPGRVQAPDRETLGRMVRDVWLEHQRAKPNPKPENLRPWEELDEGAKEVEMKMGERLYWAGAAAVPRVREQAEPLDAIVITQGAMTDEQWRALHEQLAAVERGMVRGRAEQRVIAATRAYLDHCDACEVCMDEGGCEEGFRLHSDLRAAMDALPTAPPTGSGEME